MSLKGDWAKAPPKHQKYLADIFQFMPWASWYPWLIVYEILNFEVFFILFFQN